MFKSFEDLQKYSKDQMEAATAASATITKNVQAIAAETTEYSKKSLESATAAFEKLIASKSLDGAIQVQTDYAKSAYEAFVAQNKKIGEMYAGLAKEIMKPVEAAVAAAQAK
ncbi:MAG: phasin family protein [Beijerinckiaceae bacterium]